jgi:hypothetical protein
MKKWIYQMPAYLQGAHWTNLLPVAGRSIKTNIMIRENEPAAMDSLIENPYR